MLKVVFASSEVFPYAKTGGLGDVVGALPKALDELGCEVKVFLPKYAVIDHARYELSYCWPIGEMPIRVAGHVHPVHVYTSMLAGTNVEIYFIDAPHYFNRPTIYTNDADEDERFILFQKAVIEGLQRLHWKPDILHCNDWQTGLMPLYLKDNYSWDRFYDQTASVMTIHNIGYQGRFPKSTLHKAEINERLFYPNGPIEVWNSVNFLKTGLMYADAINTVSHTYAEEIATSAMGAGLEGVLRHRINDFFGILNGVDYSVWNPETDKHIPFHYTRDHLGGKYYDKNYLLDNVKLPRKEGTPLIGIISRLVSQKGFDIVADAINELMQMNAQWVILGSGEERYEDLFRSLAYAFPDKVHTTIGYNNELSHLIEAGADIFLMPSRYEPCGLNQIYSLKYGTVPVVRRTGGLADTVQDWHERAYYGNHDGTGFTFTEPTPQALVNALQRALHVYTDSVSWYRLLQNGMTRNYSWEVSGKQYLELYKRAMHNRRKA